MVKSHDAAASLRWAWSRDRNVTGDVNLISRPSGAPCHRERDRGEGGGCC